MDSKLPPLLAAALFALGACASQPSPSQQVHATERAAMAPLKAHYPDVVMGFDFHGTTVNVSVDSNQLYQMDDDKEAALKAEALRTWRTAWLDAHPHQHGTLTMRIIDFRAVEQFHSQTKV